MKTAGIPRRATSAPAALAVGLAFSMSTPAAPPPEDASLVEAGRHIYEQGRLPSGAPVQAMRSGGANLSGPEAACRQCHQRSGMGLAEGAIVIPPVTEPALFRNERPAGAMGRRAKGIEFRDHAFKTRPPYDAAGLARAIRSGVSPTGYRFNELMPRYRLAEGDMRSLLAYLRTLSATPSPGISNTAVHIATIIAPGNDPQRQSEFLGVLRACVRPHAPPHLAGASPWTPPGQVWQLHEWALDGSPETWERQLQNAYEQQPVFATLSGLGTGEWAPVQRFCEGRQVPCLFPNVEAPASLEENAYSFYFSGGVLLEASVAARYLLQEQAKLGLTRVLVISRATGSGRRAADALRQRLAGTGLTVEGRDFEAVVSTATPMLPVTDAGARNAVVLWLQASDLRRLTTQWTTPPQTGLLLMSGLLGGLEETPLPPIWRKSVTMVYPYDPPDRWNHRMNFNLRPWLVQHHLARGDERLQGNTLAACNLLRESLLRLRGRYQRDYLVELIENYPSAMGNAPAAEAYPRFSLGTGQRFSSKGAYIVRFAPPDYQRLEQHEDWLVP